jgi:hypothetical protein
MARRRKNPPDGISPVLLVGGAIGLYLLLRPRTSSVDGLGTAGLGFSIGKSFKKLTRGVAQHSIVGKVVKKIAPPALKRVLKKVDPTVRRSAPPPPAPAGSVNEYQDENGNVISEAEYNRRMAAYAAQNSAPAPQSAGPIKVAPPAAPTPVPSFQLPTAPTQSELQRQAFDAFSSAAQASGGGGGGGGSGGGSTLMPSQQFTQAPSSADQAAPAPGGKFNPIIAAGALIAVPLVAMITGGK